MPKGSRLIKLANKFEENLKGLFVPGIFFEELGFRYFGPFDGHDLSLLIPALKKVINIKGPRIIHVVTKKGQGYHFAESEPVKFHGIGPFEVETGKCSSSPSGCKSYTETFKEKLVSLARDNNKIVAITAAMPEGTGLDKFRDLYPDRFFDVGIAEGHAICFASGLARGGLKPVVAVYSTFLQRGYDQVIEDLALQNSTVLLAIDRAGIVGEDGVTHQGIFDIAYLRHIPNLTLLAPKDSRELEAMLEFAFTLDKPVAIRYPRAATPAGNYPCAGIELGKSEVLKEGKDFLLIAIGSMVIPALDAAGMLEKEGLTGTVINARFIKPLDKKLLRSYASKTKLIFTAEEGIIEGGFGSAVSEAIDNPVEKIGLPCEFIPHGRRDMLLEKYGLTKEGIVLRIKEALRR
jgi:1-deoxy-D-xylulose-5-phosphate synthase